MSSLTVKVPAKSWASHPGNGLRRVVFLIGLLLGSPAAAERALLLFDAVDGGIIKAEQAHLSAFPASLTKLMTLYLLFEAIDTGKQTMQSTFKVSPAAASQPPKRMGLKSGVSISVKTAVEALIVFSANDVAVVVAEGLAGDETTFATMMNAKSRALGMSHTHFKNATGLPHPAQVSTARDLGVLARALYHDFNHHFGQFAKLGFDHEGKHYGSHNNFLRAFQGARGLKTGFTCRAGYNLAAAAERDGRVVMGVLLGETTAGRRDDKMSRAMHRAFEALNGDRTYTLDNLPRSSEQGDRHPVNREFIAEECINPRKSRDVYRVSKWSVVFDLETEKQLAVDRAKRLIREHESATGAKPLLIPQWAQDVIYRVAVTGLDKDKATKLCLELRNLSEHCIVLPPKAAELRVERALATMDWIAKRTQEE